HRRAEPERHPRAVQRDARDAHCRAQPGDADGDPAPAYDQSVSAHSHPFTRTGGSSSACFDFCQFNIDAWVQVPSPYAIILAMSLLQQFAREFGVELTLAHLE